MIKPLICVVGLGAVLGLMIPAGKSSTPEPAMAAVAGKPRVTELERRSNGHFYVNADVHQARINFVVDTGATTVALTLDDARRIGLKFDPADFEPVARTASGTAMGKELHLDFIDIEGKRVPHVRAMILEGLPVSLLGQSYLSRITAVQMNGDSMTLR